MAEVCRQLAELNSQLAERLQSLDVIVEGISGQVAAAAHAKSLLGQRGCAGCSHLCAQLPRDDRHACADLPACMHGVQSRHCSAL